MTATGALLPLNTTAKLLRQPPDVQHLMPDGLLLCLGCTHKHRARKGPMQACCCQWGCDSHKGPLALCTVARQHLRQSRWCPAAWCCCLCFCQPRLRMQRSHSSAACAWPICSRVCLLVVQQYVPAYANACSLLNRLQCLATATDSCPRSVLHKCSCFCHTCRPKLQRGTCISRQQLWIRSCACLVRHISGASLVLHQGCLAGLL